MPRLSEFAIAAHYAKHQISTAPHAKTICLLHDRTSFLLLSARSSDADRRLFLDKTQNILSQLQSALRQTDRVAKSIFLLYDYCYVLLERGDESDCINAQRVLGTIGKALNDALRQ